MTTDFKIETFTPEAMGWVHKGGDVYEKPDGKLYIFPPKGQHLIQKMTCPLPNWKSSDGD